MFHKTQPNDPIAKILIGFDPRNDSVKHCKALGINSDKIQGDFMSMIFWEKIKMRQKLLCSFSSEMRLLNSSRNPRCSIDILKYPVGIRSSPCQIQINLRLASHLICNHRGYLTFGVRECYQYAEERPKRQ